MGDIDGTLTGADLFWSPVLDQEKNSVSFTGSIGIDGKQKPVGTKDVDLFRFQVLSSGKLTINTASNPSTTQDFDTFLSLFDAQGQEIAVNNDDGTSQFSQIADFVINPGFYYAAVSGNGNQSYSPKSTSDRNDGATGNYLLNLNFQPTDTNGITYRATPITIEANSLPIVIDEEIGFDQGVLVENIADVDLFKVTMPDNGVFTININTPDTGYIDSFLRVLDENGNPLYYGSNLAENDNGRATDTDSNYKEFTDPLAPQILVDQNNNFVGNITDSAMIFSTSKGETYYIGVSATNNRIYELATSQNRPSSSATGKYQLEFDFKASTGLPPTQNNTTIKDIDGSITLVNDLTPIVLPLLNQPGNIGTDINPQTNQSVTVGNKDVDFVKVRFANAGLLAAKVSSKTNPNIQKQVSTNLWLFDAAGNYIFESIVLEPESTPTDPHIIVPIEANTDYYLAVSGIGNDNFDPTLLESGSDALETGDYLLNAELLPLSSLDNFTDNKLSDKGIIDVLIGDEIYGDIETDEFEDKLILVGEEDIDLYRFIPTMTGQVEIRTDIEDEDGADTNLRFFDSQGQQIAVNDDEDDITVGSALLVDVTAGQTYYIGVNGYSEQKDDYTLSGEEVVAADDDSLGSYILSLNAATGLMFDSTNNLFTVQSDSDECGIQVTLTGNSSKLVNELGAFFVDDETGKIDGIAPGEAGYTEAVLSRTKVIFSAIANLPNGFNSENLSRLLKFNSGESLRFYLVRNSTTDAVLAGVSPITDVLFSDPVNQQVKYLGTDTFSLAWKDGSGANTADFQDLVIKIHSTNEPLPLSTNLQGNPHGEVIDLRDVTQLVKADFVLNREAAFDSYIGFYQVANENGGIDTSGDGIADILTGQSGYAQAAVSRRVSSIDLKVSNQATANFTNHQLTGGSIFAPFIISNGTVEQVLSGQINQVYFAYLGANSDKVDHIRLLGNNIFGFEDLAGGGDNDFNDVIVKINLSIA